MTKKDWVLSEIAEMDEVQLDDLYHYVEVLIGRRSNEGQALGLTFMDKLMQIKIDAPPDLSERVDFYAWGVERDED